jgi:P27 family predicted phage terminase small subunit
MPTKAVNAKTMGVGKKGGGKHWTAAQVEARQEAADGMKRGRQLRLFAPSWLNVEAKKLWRDIIGKSKELDLYDYLDSECLGVYCDAVVQYRSIARKGAQSDEDAKALQSWARIIQQYADKLGLTPQSRARLVKRRADDLLGQIDDDDFDD